MVLRQRLWLWVGRYTRISGITLPIILSFSGLEKLDLHDSAIK